MLIAYIFLAVFTGVLFAVSRAVNSRLGITLGALTASFWNHIIGFLFLAVLFGVIVIGGAGLHETIGSHIPWHTYLGGFFGALFVAINSYVFPKLGALKSILLVTGAQMISGLLIDHKSVSMLHMSCQFFGVAIILLGVYLAKSASVNYETKK